MSITFSQKTAIDTLLKVDLSTVTTDRIIELCLLYRSAPTVYPEFKNNLEAEITRRFTAVEIAANDVMFSVIQNFANQFTSGVPFFAKKMLEMSTTVNRDIWFSNNSAMFAEAIEDETLLTWLVTQPAVVTKILNNSLGLTAIAKSTKASSAILSNAETVAIFKGATNVWQIVTGQPQLLGVLVLSSELMTYVFNNSVAMTAVIASSVAMTVVAASSIAMTAVAASSVAMTAVIASSTAMTAVAASSTAMAVVAASSTALSAIVKSTSARNALMSSNTIFQNNRVAIYNTVKESWTKQAEVSDSRTANYDMSVINAAVASPTGFVFASLGYFSSGGLSNITHPNNTLAAAKGTSNSPSTLANLDAVSFNGATFKSTVTGASAYAELWIPPAI